MKQPLAVESMKVGPNHFTRVLSPKYDMYAYMAILYEDEVGTCVEDPTFMIIDHILMIS